MAESEVVRVAREYRERLAKNEDSALREMARQWAIMEKKLNDSYVAVSQEIIDLQAQGVAVPKQLLYNRKRYQEMLAQVQKNLAEYDKFFVRTVKAYQRKNYNLGLDSASAVIKATKPSSSIWNEVPRDAVEVVAGFAGNGAPLGQLLERDYGVLSERITDAITTGVGLGKGAFAVARDIQNEVAMEYDRAIRIARTEINRAYRIANAEAYRASGVVTKVLRLCYPPTACFACLMMDGEECPNFICDDHPNGKCTTIAVTTGGNYPEWQHGSDWLLDQSEEDQRRIMGDARFELWKQNGIPLRDMVTMKDNPVWGGSPSIISIKDLEQRYNIGKAKTVISAPTVPQMQTPTSTPKTSREEAIDKVKDSDWYKSAMNVSKNKDELERYIDGMTEEQAKVFSNGFANADVSGGFDFNARSGYVSPSYKSVNVPLNKPASKDTARGHSTAITTTFHELTHGVDLLNNEHIFVISGLRDKIEEEALVWCNDILDGAGVPQLKSFGRMTKDQKDVINRHLARDKDMYHSICDTLGGLTKSRIGGRAKDPDHPWSTVGYGHDTNYWDNPFNLEKEFVAHSGQAWITGDEFESVFFESRQMVINEMVDKYGK